MLLFDKYEYLAVEEILPPDQSRIIEQAKFAYSPLGRAFQKQIKTFEKQEKKQLKAIEEHGKQLVESNALKRSNYDSEKNSLSLLKQKEIFNKIINERHD